jgi:hypothetical protein
MTLEELADRMEIIDLYARYVNYVDASNLAAIDEQCYLPDTHFDMREAGGTEMSWIEVRESGFLTGGAFELYFHISVNQVIEFDADRSHAYVVSKTFNPWARVNDAGAARTFHNSTRAITRPPSSRTTGSSTRYRARIRSRCWRSWAPKACATPDTYI